LILVGFVAIVFLSFFILPRRKSKLENNVTPLWEERCNVRKSVGYGMFAGGNLPVWRVSLYDKFMVIGALWPTVMPYNEITKVEYKQNLLSKAISIHQHTADRKHVITIYSANPTKMLEVLSPRVQVTRT
jgi:hypothetical protein